MNTAVLIDAAYLLAAVLFILGLKGLSHPKSAVRGNLMGATGMLIAIVVTLLRADILGYGLILAGLALGAVVGVILALTIKMTAMPQLVGLFNGFGGIASVLVAGAVLYQVMVGAGSGVEAAEAGGPDLQFTIATVASGLIGAVTFFGSLIAFGKLQGIVTEKPVRYTGEQIVKALLFLGAIAAGVTSGPGVRMS